MKFMRRCILILYIVLPSCLFSQYDSLLHRSYADKAAKMHSVFDSILSIGDSVLIAQKTKELRQFAIRHKDKGLEMEIDLFELYVNAFLQNQPQDKSVVLLQRLIGKAEKENIWHVKINATRALAEYYWKFIKNYELAFEQYLLLDKELKTIKPDEYPQMARDFNQIGESYYFFRDYTQAKKYFKEALALPETEFNTMVRTSAKNTMGLCYQREEKYDSSDYYFRQVLQTPFEGSRIAWGRIAKGNLGTNHYKRKEYDLAIPLLQYNLKGAIAGDDYWSMSAASTVLADIFLQKGDLKTSWEYIEQAKEGIKNSGQRERLRLLFPIISNWYGKKGNETLSQLYLDSTIQAINKYHEDFNAIKVLHAQQKINRQDEFLMKTEFALEKQKKINERNLMIIIAFCLCMIIVLGYFIQKRRRQYIEFEKLKVENELKQAQNEINRFISKVNDQNKILERFYQELEAFKNSESEEKKLLEKTIAELRSATILTDDDWIGFKQHFTTIYPEFISLLKNKYPSVTDSEMRYLMLTKLQMSHKEMAQVLGISADSVRVTWNRVRKKLGGGLGDTPQSLIEKIN
jgi:hypothetical protein